MLYSNRFVFASRLISFNARGALEILLNSSNTSMRRYNAGIWERCDWTLSIKGVPLKPKLQKRKQKRCINDTGSTASSEEINENEIHTDAQTNKVDFLPVNPQVHPISYGERKSGRKLVKFFDLPNYCTSRGELGYELALILGSIRFEIFIKGDFHVMSFILSLQEF